MINILWISLCTPYKTIKHAGGQALYHHIVSFTSNSEFNLKVISLCSEAEWEDAKRDIVNAETEMVLDRDDSISKFLNLESRINLWNRFGGYLSNSRYQAMKKVINEETFSPDIVILNWTEMIAFSVLISNKFPTAKIVDIEEDVSFQKRKRRSEKYNKKSLMRFLHYKRYKNSKKRELEWLRMADAVVVYNYKDKNILINNGIREEKVTVLTPQFYNMSTIKHHAINNDIIYWGALSRNENVESVIWFLDNVMPLLSDIDIRFVAVGAKPPEKLLIRESENVIFTGYVENPTNYFSDSLCLVAPIVIGAGIKIKILEGLSAGIPVITNDIGIEGIQAKDGQDFLLCNTPREFSEKIHEIYYDKNLAKEIGNSGQSFIINNYSGNGDVELQEVCKRLVI